MKWLGWIIAVMAVGCALAGCARGAEPPSTEADIRGVVTSLSNGGSESVSLRVVWTDDVAIGTKAAYDAAQVTANADTEWFSRAANGATSGAEVTDVAVGTVVEAWFTGPIAESYPVQVKAGTIVILGTYDGELPEPPGLGL